MLRVTTIKGPSGAVVEYFVGLAQDQLTRDGEARGPIDYYLDPGEPPGQWWGDGCDDLGVSGDVHPDALRSLLEGRHPFTGKALGRRFGDASARAFDATFSAPKSVSVLWALADEPDVRAEVLAAHDTAVTAALSWLERHGALTRRGTDGVHQVDTTGLTVAVFRQHTSRLADPQLHTHAVILAKVLDLSGRWLSLDARFLKFHQRGIGWVYQAVLRRELRQRLGLAWEAVENGHADLRAIPQSLRDLFSRRSTQVAERLGELIEEWVEEHDGAEPDPRTVARLERQAALLSRPGKEKGIPAEELRAEWAERAGALGFGPLVLAGAVPEPSGPWDPEAVVAEALARVAEAGATWHRADLAGEIATLLPPDAAGSPDALVDLVDALTEHAASHCVELHPPDGGTVRRRDGRPVSEHVTDRLLTTTAVLAEERRILAWAAAAATDPHAAAPLPAPVLSHSQQVAASAVAGRGPLVLVVGPAGTGKTASLRASVAALCARGRAVVGVAPSGKAADVLARETGCRAVTLAALLTAHRVPTAPTPGWELPGGTTVIVDEAGMASTPDLDSLVALAAAHGWRLVLVGDPDQLPAVGRGGMFADLCERFPAVRLEDVHRFVEPWQAEASLALRAGHPEAAEAYAAHDRVHTVHPGALAGRVARIREAFAALGESVAITTSTSETARRINVEIQRRRRPTGLSVPLADGTLAFAGDRVATRRNARRFVTDLGRPVRNRQAWDVVGVHTDGALTLHHPERGTVRLPGAYVAEHVELGWAVTGYGNQGDTLDHGICVVEAGSSRAGVYVGMTRGRHVNVALVVDGTGVADPAEALAAVIARPRNGLTAHATRERLYRSRGLAAPPLEQAGAAAEAARQARERLADLKATARREPPGLGL